jgi:hypothetical protein
MMAIIIIFFVTIFFVSSAKHENDKKYCHNERQLPMPTFHVREELGMILKNLSFKIGAELGVQQGIFAFNTLKSWKTADRFVLVDIWAPQQNYKDAANKWDHNANMALTDGRMKDAVSQKWVNKYTMCRNFTTSCVQNYDDLYFDYIYVDARHDYKGALLDIVQWWPKLKVGGIMAGHDYMTQKDETASADPERNGDKWIINYDGTVDESGRVVKGAVDDFFSGDSGHLRRCPHQVTVSYRESAWNTWAVRK